MARLSLCLIARNEERMLPGCLDSVKGVVDEVVLVDTGSTDATRQLAASRGALVLERPWDDDFAAPRNLAIERATGDWILVLDADERLAPGGAPAIRRAMKRRDLDLGLLRLHNASRSDASAAEVLSGAARIGEINNLPRLLRRTPDLRYRGLIHEDVSDWVAARGMRIDLVKADILHLGAMPALRDALGKRARNLALLEKRCRLEPDSIVPVGYLAMEHWDAGEVEEAKVQAERGWALLDAQPLHRSAALVGAVRAFCQARAGDGAGLAETVNRLVAREGMRRDLAFLGGIAAELRAPKAPGPARGAALKEALDIYLMAKRATYPLEERCYIAGSGTWAAAIRAGSLLLQLGRPREALDQFDSALAEVPGNQEALRGANEAAKAISDRSVALQVRPPGRPSSSHPHGPKAPRLSLCMIVRNEQELLPGCLASVEGLVDEIVVVDTGSVDGTRELARRAGALVLERPWDDDFSAPRNEALRHATGDWILQLDADERLVPGSAKGLRAAMAREDLDLGMLRLHDARRVDAALLEVVAGTERMGAPSVVPRLMRRTPDLEYRGIVHESVEAWLARRGSRLGLVEADLVHLGAVPERRATLGKRERNMALLERRCQLDPESITPFGFLAMEYWEAGRHGEAMRTAEAGWALLETQPRHRAAHLLGVARALCQARAGDHAGMATTLDRLIGREGLRSDSALLRGLSRELAAREQTGAERSARLEAAVAGYQEALATDPAQQERVCIGGSGSWFARIRLGTVELQRGHAAEALALFRAALAEQPGSGEALFGESEALLDLGQPDRALAHLEPLLRTHGKTPDGWVLAAAAAGALGATPDAAFLLGQAAGRVAAGFVAPHRAGRHLALLSGVSASPSVA